MHNSRPDVDSKALLLAVNRCSMRLFFCPNIAVVAVVNPLQVEVDFLCKQNNCGKVGLLCTTMHKWTRKLFSIKVICRAQSLHFLPMERLELLLAYIIPYKVTISTEFVGNRRVLVERLSSKRCKTSSSNCGVRTDRPRPVLCLFTANVPVSGRRRSTEANCNNLDTLYPGKARDKPSALPCLCHTQHPTPSGCRRVRPRCSSPS